MVLYDLINAHHTRSAGEKFSDMEMARKKQYTLRNWYGILCVEWAPYNPAFSDIY